MKRRAISFITSLALCLSLCTTWALAGSQDVTLNEDMVGAAYDDITYSMVFDGRGHTYTVPDEAAAMVVEDGGSLELRNVTIKSEMGSGVHLRGGSLTVNDTEVTVTGSTYGLDISSGAAAQLSGGKFSGEIAAIRAEDGYASLLVTGYAFFDESIPLLPGDVSGLKTVTVKECTVHEYDYTANNGSPTHNGICKYCKTEVTGEDCTFSFTDSNLAKCNHCSHTITAAITVGDLVYDSTDKAANVSVSVTLDDGTPLTEGSDFDTKVEPTSRVDVGEFTVTVTSQKYGFTYQQTFHVTQAQPVITWNTAPVAVDYNGHPVDETRLPAVTIKMEDSEKDWSTILAYHYFYRERSVNGSSLPYTEGLPTNAGTYDVIVRVPGTQNYKAAESAPIALTVRKINPMIENPKAIEDLVYNGTAQNLVTGGAVWDGAVILYALGEGDSAPDASDYSEAIPTGINAGSYGVWYKVEETQNYISVIGTILPDIEIRRKQITPIVELEYDTCVYDGGEKRPKVTVRDNDDYWNPLPGTEYTVTYANNQNVSTDENPATVTVKDTGGGNYAIRSEDGKDEIVVTFRITPKDQAALTITNRPNTVSYGDVFTLGTDGGSGSGTVTWKIITAKDAEGKDVEDFTSIASIDANSGQVTVRGLGTVTVQAKKSGTDNDGNHKDMTAEWAFTAGPRHVTATVTAENKVFNGNNTAAVHAKVEQGVVFDDDITIGGLTGTFSDANVGTGKSVTVVTSGAEIKINDVVISGKANELYIVTIPTAPVRADITKAATSISEGTPTTKTLTYNGEPQDLFATEATASTVTGVTATVEYALNESGPYSTVIPQATNAGSYEVWYRVRETDNYFGTATKSKTVTIDKKPVTASVSLSQVSYPYDGKAKEPAVTVRENGASGAVIPPAEYTVTYSNNVDAGKATTDTEDGTEITFDPDAPSVTVTAKENGNYAFGTVQMNFEITTGGKAVLTKSPEARDLTYNGQAQELVTVGTATGGQLVYALANRVENGTPVPGTGSTSSPPADTDYKPEIPRGQDAGEYIVYYKVQGDGNYVDSDVSYVFVTIRPKTVTSPDITLPDKTFTYTGSAQAYTSEEEKQITVKDGGETIPATEYTVSYSSNINAGTASVHINDRNGGNYTVSGTAYFMIGKADIVVAEANKPTGRTSLPYNGAGQALITRGSSPDGTMVYSLDGKNYFEDVPTASEVKEYTVHYKVLGDSNHKDSTPDTVTASIIKNTVTRPTITLSSTVFRYNGGQQKPTVTVRDDKGLLIDENEYVVTVSGKDASGNDIGSDSVLVGTYTVTVTAPASSNYDIKAETDETGKPNNTAAYKIVAADQEAISITGTRAQVYYGDEIQLGITGGTGDGEVTWSVTSSISESDTTSPRNKISGDGLLTIRETGPFTVTATRKSSSGNYGEVSATWVSYANKKPVTAVLTGGDKTYDGGINTTVTATVNDSDLVSGDPGIILSLPGTFDNANAGTGKEVTLTDPRPIEHGNYIVSCPASTTADITPKQVTTNVVLTNPSDPIVYNGTEQKPAVTVTFTDGGTAVTAIQEGADYAVAYSNNINAGTATVTVKNVDGGNYTIYSAENFTIEPAKQQSFSIDKISGICYGDAFTLSTTGGSGDGKVTWSVSSVNSDATFNSNSGLLTVTGIQKVTITATKAASTDGNYQEATDTWTFTADPKRVNAVVTAKDKVYDKNTDAELLVKVLAGGIEITGIEITVKEGVHGTFDTADVGTGKTVKFTITEDDVIVKGNEAGNYEIVYPAADSTTTASITPALLSEEDLDELGITLKVNEGLTYHYNPERAQELVDVTGNADGTLEYSLDGITYGTNVPTGTNADTYTVWYRVKGDGNSVGSVKVTISKAVPEILNRPTATSINYGQSLSASVISGSASYEGKDVPGTFTWAYDTVPLLSNTSWPAIFTPANPNFESVTDIWVQVDLLNEPPKSSTSSSNTSPGGGSAGASSAGKPGEAAASTQTTVRNGASSTVLNTAAGDELVKEAAANQSGNVVIKPKITGGVTKTEVSLPASAVNRLGSETDAALTVSTPVADVTIPNESLGALSGAGGTVSVVTEQVNGNTVVLTLTAGGKDVESVPGGLTLTVPVEDAGPGTVAVLVYEDGARETIRWSVVEGDGIRIPLDGSATVEIVDNSRVFTDVPAENWAAGAVTFASAHELFNGTGNAAFSPELSMSRAMLATVLYNLEGNPELSLADGFSDVGSGTWYTAGVSWAAENGIVAGYGNGQFGPDDSITREQLAVMLWRYAGSPEADGQSLNFVDADQVSGYAKDAIYWATANGIINGCGDGRLDPVGLATRAQAAQMLKNFIENT